MAEAGLMNDDMRLNFECESGQPRPTNIAEKDKVSPARDSGERSKNPS
jgi:hypothetical protein